MKLQRRDFQAVQTQHHQQEKFAKLIHYWREVVFHKVLQCSVDDRERKNRRCTAVKVTSGHGHVLRCHSFSYRDFASVMLWLFITISLCFFVAVVAAALLLCATMVLGQTTLKKGE